MPPLCHVVVRYASKVDGGRFTPTNLGLGLVVAYKNINLELGKPYLRAAMEADCQAIALGTKTTSAVVAQCLTQASDRAPRIALGAIDG